MTTVAAIDCGTNSIRLLILRKKADGAVVELAREVRLARLGQGVDATGEFHPDALARANVIFEEYARI
ncbi:MAG TPA: exopolyphosphatase, partial [Arachnia sp.]|nr:exopolyphosphatase [Arachnia sp.]